MSAVTAHQNHQSGAVQFWNWENRQHMRPPLMCKNKVFCVAFSPTGKQIAASHYDMEVDLWESGSGTHRLFMGHCLWVGGLAFLKDHRTLISAGGDRVVKIWDLPTGQERFNLQGESSTFQEAALAVSPDERLIAAGARDGTVHLYWAASEEQVRAAGW